MRTAIEIGLLALAFCFGWVAGWGVAWGIAGSLLRELCKRLPPHTEGGAK